jgi:hypothetical protein
MNCDEKCMRCDSRIDYLVNFSRYHGLCSYHINALGVFPGLLECVSCGSIVPSMQKISIRCTSCNKPSYSSFSNCSHSLCENCYNSGQFCYECPCPCRACGDEGRIIRLYCNHRVCENCFRKTENQCPECLREASCKNCRLQKETGCIHEFCVDCSGYCDLCNPRLVIIDCEVCRKNGKKFESGCNHRICEDCFYKTNNCVICFPPTIMIDCRVCKKRKKKFESGCNHRICEDCFYKTNSCVICFPPTIMIDCVVCKETGEKMEVECNHATCKKCFYKTNNCGICFPPTIMIDCGVCKKRKKKFEAGCNHAICENCFDKTNSCSICFPIMMSCQFCRKRGKKVELECKHSICEKCFNENNIKCPVCSRIKPEKTICMVCRQEKNTSNICLHRLCKDCLSRKDNKCPICFSSNSSSFLSSKKFHSNENSSKTQISHNKPLKEIPKLSESVYSLRNFHETPKNSYEIKIDESIPLKESNNNKSKSKCSLNYICQRFPILFSYVKDSLKKLPERIPFKWLYDKNE